MKSLNSEEGEMVKRFSNLNFEEMYKKSKRKPITGK